MKSVQLILFLRIAQVADHLVDSSSSVEILTLYKTLSGHKSDVVDLSFGPSPPASSSDGDDARTPLLISASIDKTVRLWSLQRPRISIASEPSSSTSPPANRSCLGVFAHPDFVTSCCFHPFDEKLFITGAFDKKLRVWNIGAFFFPDSLLVPHSL